MTVLVRARIDKNYLERSTISDNRYKKRLRFEKESVQPLTDLFLHETHETKGCALSARSKILLLRYLADPGFQNGVGEDFDVHRSTVLLQKHLTLFLRK